MHPKIFSILGLRVYAVTSILSIEGIYGTVLGMVRYTILQLS